jgi:hypothetical protein
VGLRTDVALFENCAEHLGVMELESFHEPPWVDGEHDHEDRDGQHEVDRFEHFDNALRGAPVEVVDVQDNPIDARSAAVRLAHCLAEAVSHLLEVTSNQVDDAEPVAIVRAFGALFDVRRQPSRRRRAGEFGFELVRRGWS